MGRGLQFCGRKESLEIHPLTSVLNAFPMLFVALCYMMTLIFLLIKLVNFNVNNKICHFAFVGSR